MRTILLLMAGLLSAPPVAAGDHAWPVCGTVEHYPGESWPATDPGKWDTRRLKQAESLDRTGGVPAAVLVVHKGRPVASWGEVATPRLLQSVRKALLNALVGLELRAGRLSLEDTLVELGINDDPPLPDLSREAKVEHLLLSRSGILHGAHYEVGGWKRLRQQLRELRLGSTGVAAYPPGTYWFYNNWDFNALGTIVEQSAGASLGELFRERIADPLQMQDFKASHVEYTGNGSISAWSQDNDSRHPAYAFRMSARDLARYGTLYLACGQWRDRKILPTEWVTDSVRGVDTLKGSPENNWQKEFGYFGYLWWVDRGGRRRHKGLPTDVDMYFSSGNGGHRLVVIPSLDLVIAHVVPTPGGVGDWDQIRRRLFGKASMSAEQLSEVIGTIIAAHPDRRT